MNDPRETIGRCEGFCGLVDHHLVKGLCPRCSLMVLPADHKAARFSVGKEHTPRLNEASYGR